MGERRLTSSVMEPGWQAEAAVKQTKKKTDTHRGVQVTAIHLHSYHNIKTGEAMEVP